MQCSAGRWSVVNLRAVQCQTEYVCWWWIEQVKNLGRTQKLPHDKHPNKWGEGERFVKFCRFSLFDNFCVLWSLYFDNWSVYSLGSLLWNICNSIFLLLFSVPIPHPGSECRKNYFCAFLNLHGPRFRGKKNY